MTMHEQHVEYINSMSDKYDYKDFLQHCIDNNLPIMPFAIFANIVEPFFANRIELVSPSELQDIISKVPCGSCGGGKVL